MADTTTYQFTNKRDAIRFAKAYGGPIEIYIDQIARGQWVVTIIGK